jgi:hypothetical protein
MLRAQSEGLRVQNRELEQRAPRAVGYSKSPIWGFRGLMHLGRRQGSGLRATCKGKELAKSNIQIEYLIKRVYED